MAIHLNQLYLFLSHIHQIFVYQFTRKSWIQVVYLHPVKPSIEHWNFYLFSGTFHNMTYHFSFLFRTDTPLVRCPNNESSRTGRSRILPFSLFNLRIHDELIKLRRNRIALDAEICLCDENTFTVAKLIEFSFEDQRHRVSFDGVLWSRDIWKIDWSESNDTSIVVFCYQKDRLFLKLLAVEQNIIASNFMVNT